MERSLVFPDASKFVMPIKPINNFDGACPQHLKLVLRSQVLELFKYRKNYKNLPINDEALDLFINDWWENHKILLNAASLRPEWSWDDLAVIVDRTIKGSPKMLDAWRNTRFLLRGSCSHNCRPYSAGGEPDDYYCDKHYSNKTLYKLFEKVIYEIMFEHKPEKSSTHTINMNKTTVDDIKEFYNTYCPCVAVERNGRSIQLPKFDTVFGFGLSKLPAETFKNKELYDSLLSLLEDEDNQRVFMSSLYKYAGCCQTAKTKEGGPSKVTVINKLIQLYFKFVLRQLKELASAEINHFPKDGTVEDAYNWLVQLDYSKKGWIATTPFKQRNARGDSFFMYDYGSFSQITSRIADQLSGVDERETFVISFHPCDLLTASLGYKWSSCHSFINDLIKFPSHYGTSENGHTYDGMYHGGNFCYAAANAFITYIPHKLESPLFLTAKDIRMWMWANKDLTQLRQHKPYPQNSDSSITEPLCKSIRVYVQNMFAPINNSRGTADWETKKRESLVTQSSSDNCLGFLRSQEFYKASHIPNRAGTPILLSKDMHALNAKPSVGTIVTSTRFHSEGYRVSVPDSNTTPTCLVQAWDKDFKEIECPIERTMVINDNQFVTLDFYLAHYKDITIENNMYLYNAKKFKTKSGFKYSLELPENVVACKKCGNFFDKEILIDGYCTECALTEADLTYVKLKDLFIKGEIAITFTSETLSNFFSLFTVEELRWKSGKVLSDYMPTDTSKVLVVKNNSVILQSPILNILPVYSLEGGAE